MSESSASAETDLVKPGSETSEKKLTVWAIIAIVISIIAQIVFKTFFDVDLGINIDTALLSLGLPTSVYTIGRSLLKKDVIEKVIEASKGDKE